MPSGKTISPADRALCPEAAARAAQRPIRTIAAAMRTAGVAGPLEVDMVQLWLDQPAQAPPW